MNRTLRIAWREYLGFLKTPGFWISLMLAPIGAALGGLAPGLMERSAPAPVLAVVDLTTPDAATAAAQPHAPMRERNSTLYAAIRRSLEEAGDAAGVAEMASKAQEAAGPVAAKAVRDAGVGEGGPLRALETLRRVAPKAARGYRPPQPTARLVDAPAAAWAAATPEAAGRTLRPYLAGDKGLSGQRGLDAAAVLHGPTDKPMIDFWSRNLGDRSLERAVRDAVADHMRGAKLRAAGLDPSLLTSLDSLKPDVRDFSPKAGRDGAASGLVSGRDRLPTLAGFGLAFMLWALILTGAGILLNSVIEEKANRVLEVLLSSADTHEILGGKILGVAALSTTVMAMWVAIGLTLLNRQSPGMVGELFTAVTAHGLVVWFLLYFVVGYLMYASLFAAIGSFCETSREAQTLLGPVMILLTVPMIFLSVAIRRPDAPIIQALSWFPPFTPFLMTARAAAGLPWIELVGTLLLMVVTAAGVVWFSAKAFRAGALSTVKLDPKGAMLALYRAARSGRAPA